MTHAKTAPPASVHAVLGDERFQLLVDSVRDYAIFMLDPHGRVSTWNTGAARIKGYSAREIVGKHFSTFYTEPDLQSGKCEHELEVARREGRVEDEGWRVRKDGSRFWANVVITTLRDATGTLVGYAKVTRDLTERKSAEEERIRLVHAEEAIRLRDEFLSIASHELKTPLTAMQLQLEALEDRLGPVDEKLADRVARAMRSSARLEGLIDSLLDVSRIATGRLALQFSTFDLRDAVTHTSDSMRGVADLASCELRVHAETSIVGTWDRLRVEQIVSNLLGNALKYGSSRPVDIYLTRAHDSAVIEVCDRGAGIEESELTRIFERFERAAATRNYGGLGLGLYVTREIATAHGGTATARNRDGGGAHFTVTLPIVRSSAIRASGNE